MVAMKHAIDPCAKCGEVGVLQTPDSPAMNNGALLLVMRVRCMCRVRYSVHEFASVNAGVLHERRGVFEEAERMASEAVAQWNALQAAERSSR